MSRRWSMPTMAACWNTKLENPMPPMPFTSVTTIVPYVGEEAVDRGPCAAGRARRRPRPPGGGRRASTGRPPASACGGGRRNRGGTSPRCRRPGCPAASPPRSGPAPSDARPGRRAPPPRTRCRRGTPRPARRRWSWRRPPRRRRPVGPPCGRHHVDAERRAAGQRLDGEQPAAAGVPAWTARAPARAPARSAATPSGSAAHAPGVHLSVRRGPGIRQRPAWRSTAPCPGVRSRASGGAEHVGDTPRFEAALEGAVLTEGAVDEGDGDVVATGQRGHLVPVELEVEGPQLGLEVGAGVGVVVDGRQPVGPQLPVDEDHGQLGRRVGLEVRHPRLDGAGADVALLARARRRRGGPSPDRHPVVPQSVGQPVESHRPAGLDQHRAVDGQGRRPGPAPRPGRPPPCRRRPARPTATTSMPSEAASSPIRRWASGRPSPSSAISPSTATRRGASTWARVAQGGLHRVRVGVVRVVEDPQAGRASARLRPQLGCPRPPPPRPGRRRTRHRRTRRRPRRRRRWPPGGRPAPTGWPRPTPTASRSGPSAAGRRRGRRRRPARPRWSVPKVTTVGVGPGPHVRAAVHVVQDGIAGGWQPLDQRTLLAAGHPPGPPRCSRWADPIEVMTPTVGRVSSTQPGDVPGEPGSQLDHHRLDPVGGTEQREGDARARC